MNEYDSVQPAYENGPKEVNHKRRMNQSKEQAGDLADMTPQVNKKVVIKEHPKKIHHRHKEHR